MASQNNCFVMHGMYVIQQGVMKRSMLVSAISQPPYTVAFGHLSLNEKPDVQGMYDQHHSAGRYYASRWPHATGTAML